MLVQVSPDPENVEQIPPAHVAVGVAASDSEAVRVTV